MCKRMRGFDSLPDSSANGMEQSLNRWGGKGLVVDAEDLR